MNAPVSAIVARVSRLANAAKLPKEFGHYTLGVVTVEHRRYISEFVTANLEATANGEAMPSIIAEVERVSILATGGFND